MLIEAEFCVGGLEGGVEEVSATDNYWEEETREAAQHPSMHETVPTTKNHLISYLISPVLGDLQFLFQL